MIDEDPLRVLRIANMHFAPRTPLRALCVSKCVAQHSRVDLQRLPAHVRDEIVRAAGVGEHEEATKAPKRARQEEEEEEQRPPKRARAGCCASRSNERRECASSFLFSFSRFPFLLSLHTPRFLTQKKKSKITRFSLFPASKFLHTTTEKILQNAKMRV
eukprot:TRINITY_DN3825_c0_g1_i3.p2 TRINITY_DN3825_c0_g1~~TRINITY_DN3825_c0_g1_i3.p2  ORF type:complete len:179 (+),score=50.54 TRINITY_DN3825_c0_g1_i3:62-538(+)